MLIESIGWCGKLPIQPDFIQSYHFPGTEKKIMDWIALGQNHIGEQLVRSQDLNRIIHFYYFRNKSFSVDGQPVQGLLFNSQDQRGRACPFVIFSLDPHIELKIVFSIFFEQIKALNFNFSMLNANLIQLQLVDKIMVALDKLDKHIPQTTEDYWLELYPSLTKFEIHVDKTNHIVFRKLMLR